MNPRLPGLAPPLRHARLEDPAVHGGHFALRGLVEKKDSEANRGGETKLSCWDRPAWHGLGLQRGDGLVRALKRSIEIALVLRNAPSPAMAEAAALGAMDEHAAMWRPVAKQNLSHLTGGSNRLDEAPDDGAGGTRGRIAPEAGRALCPRASMQIHAPHDDEAVAHDVPPPQAENSESPASAASKSSNPSTLDG